MRSSPSFAETVLGLLLVFEKVMNCSWNPETVRTSFFASACGTTLSRIACAARSSAYRCVLALPFTGDFFRSSKKAPVGRTSLMWYSQPFVSRTQEGDGECELGWRRWREVARWVVERRRCGSSRSGGMRPPWRSVCAAEDTDRHGLSLACQAF